ncbi:MAG TPA: hypothetical protein VIU87_20830, partial [Mycobacterium sp.]
MAPTIGGLVGADTYHLAVRSIKLYLLVGVVGAVGALVWGAGAGWILAVGIGAPALAVLLPRFAAGALAGALTPSAR